MEKDKTDMLIFIDLGFILLVGFLFLTTTTPDVEIPLPDGQRTEQVSASSVYEVQFNKNMNFVVGHISNNTVMCADSGIDQLTGCINRINTFDNEAAFLLAPQGETTVQQLVSVLDVCSRESYKCSVDG